MGPWRGVGELACGCREMHGTQGNQLRKSKVRTDADGGPRGASARPRRFPHRAAARLVEGGAAKCFFSIQCGLRNHDGPCSSLRNSWPRLVTPANFSAEPPPAAAPARKTAVFKVVGAPLPTPSGHRVVGVYFSGITIVWSPEQRCAGSPSTLSLNMDGSKEGV